MLKLICVLVALTPLLAFAQVTPKKIVCFYNSKSHYRDDSGKFTVTDLERSLTYCTHIVYGYAKLDAEDFKLKPLDYDLDVTKGNYKAVTELKKKNPNLRVLLSVGGWADSNDTEKYMNLLRDGNSRRIFVSSAAAFLQEHDFDGLDLAWQFPLVRVKERSSVGSVWHKIKKTFGASKGSKDPQAAEHKSGFTALIKALKLSLNPDNRLLTTSVIPHTNYTVYYDVKEVMPSLDAIHLHAFDFLTPEDKISPESADYPAPLNQGKNRIPQLNVDAMVTWFLTNSAPPMKLILGVPTYGRTWKLNTETSTGTPPLEADGPGAEEHLTKERGLLSYAEICTMSENYLGTSDNAGLLRRVKDPWNKQGTYSYRNEHNDKEALWVGHEDASTITHKADYAKRKGLGGMSIHDISLDDFRGVCTEGRFPLTKAAKTAI